MRIFLISLLALSLLFGCGGDGENGGEGGNGGNGGGGEVSGIMTATIDGSQWQSTYAFCTIKKDSIVKIEGARQEGNGFCAIKFDFHYHNISVPETISYTYFDPNYVEHFLFYSCSATMTAYSTQNPHDGEVIITLWEGVGGKIKGTFHFIGVNQGDTVTVENGYFEIPIRREP